MSQKLNPECMKNSKSLVLQRVVAMLALLVVLVTSVPLSVIADELFTSTPNNATYGEGDFKVALSWGGTSNTEYNWNATGSEDRVIKLTFYYQNEVTPRAYQPGDLVVTIPGIGKLNRNETLKAYDIAADEYGATEMKRDWSYKYNKSTDTYTFYNNHAIEAGSTFNGSFEMIYKFKSRESVNGYTKNIQATLTDGNVTATSQQLTLNYASLRDTFYIEKNASSLVSADGLSKYVENGKNVSDYGWVVYTFRYNVDRMNARGLQTRYMTDTFPEGCIVASERNVIKNLDGTVTYMVPETTVPENSVENYSVIVGYPEEYIGQTVTNTAYLTGKYKDENETILLAQDSVDVEVKRVQNQVVGILSGKAISPSHVHSEEVREDMEFSANLYATTRINDEDKGYKITLMDDYLEVYTDDGYIPLSDDEYNFTKITVPGWAGIKNSNGYAIEEGDYQIRLYALYKEDVIEGDASSRAIENYTLVYEGAWGPSSYTATLPKDALAVRVELEGLNESINSFYVTVNGTIGIADNIDNGTYKNPKEIINYDIRAFKDKDGNSLLPEIRRVDYSQERIYDRDYEVYGEGQYRSSAYIVIQDDPSNYYARTDISEFSVDENIEYFVTQLLHQVDVDNRNENAITNIEVHGVVNKDELETQIDSLVFTYDGLVFKHNLPSDVDMQDYLKERATITKEGREISISFNFADNPIVAKSFKLGYTVDGQICYEDYYDSSNPSYTVDTYAYIADEGIRPQATTTHEGKTMATSSDSESILLALASHQQLVKMVQTLYSGEFVQEDAVTPMTDVYTYRLKLRNGYNTLVDTEFIDILEHAELTEVDGEYPYEPSEWHGTFASVDTTYVEDAGYETEVYYANSLAPTAGDWVLMENYSEGIWTTTAGNEANVKAIKVEIDGEILENSITYVDVNMTAPYDVSLVDKKAYNTYQVNCNAIDLYTGMQTIGMVNMPSNVVDIRLIEKEYNVAINKVDATSHGVLSGVEFGVYDANGNEVDAVVTNMLGKTVIKGLKAGTYTLREKVAPAGYKPISLATLVINQNGSYTFVSKTIIEGNIEPGFTSTGTYGWVQNPDGTWQSDNYNVNKGIAIMESEELVLPLDGTISFDWSVSSEGGSWDYVYYTIKNAQTGNTVIDGTSIGGTSYGTAYDSLKYNSVTQNLSAGSYTIEFTYRKDSSTHKGLDRAFVKNVKLEYSYEEEIQNTTGSSEMVNNVPTINLDVINARAEGSITVHKIDEYLNHNGDEIPFAGVIFDLCDVNGSVLDTQTTDANGNATFRNLAWGVTYVVKEQQAPQGYELAQENVYLSRLNKDRNITIENIRKEGTVELTKQDEVDGTPIEGAAYGLYANEDIYDKDANIVYEKDALVVENATNEQGKVTFNNIPWGKYYVKETRTVYGYDLSDKAYPITIVAQNVENVIELNEDEKRSRANLQLIKIDEDENFLPGVEFTLFNEDGSIAKSKEGKYVNDELSFTSTGTYAWEQNADGVWKNKGQGVLNLTTTMTSNEFTLEVDGKVSFDWSVSSQGTSYDYVYYTIYKDGSALSGTGDTSATKIGGTTYGSSEDNMTYMHVNKYLEAGTYTIAFTYRKNINTNSGLDTAFVKNVKIEYDTSYEEPIIATTDAIGQINMQHIAWGNYYMKETKAAEGYECRDTEYSFTVDRETFKNNNATVTQVLNEDTSEEVSVIRNNRQRGKVTLTKYACDASGNETTDTLEGAIYELCASNGALIGEYTTDEDGKIEVENLDWNSYYFMEKEAPAGYSVSDKKISFAVNSRNAGFVQELVAYDKLESGELTINKVINENDICNAHGNSTFIFKIVGKDGGEEKVTYYRTATFTEGDISSADIDGDITKTIKITDIDPYVYEITEEKNYRFDTQTITPVTANAEVEGNVGIITLTGAQNKGEITFTNEKVTNSLLTDSELITNSTQSEYYVIGVIAEPKEESYSVGLNVTGDDFTYTLLYSGGQEVSAESSAFDGVTFDGKSTYSQNDIGNYITGVEITYNGKTYETEVTTRWVLPADYYAYKVLNATDKTIAITGVSSKYNSPEVLYIPSVYNGYRVIQVGEGGSKLSNISNVKTVEFARGIEKIASYAFYRCSGLTGDLIIPEGVTSIGDSAFCECSGLTGKLVILEGVTRIEDSVFKDCFRLTSIEIPKGVTSIGEYAFYGCSGLTGKLEIPEGTGNIKKYAFYGCRGFSSIEIPEGVTSIGNYAFYGCRGLTGKLVIPEGVTSIGGYSFENCSGLTGDLVIPEGVTSIGAYAFDGCSGLTRVEIPASLNDLSSHVFDYCSSLTSIEVALDNEMYCDIDGVLYNRDKSTIIKFPEGKKQNSFSMPSSVTSIEDSAFRGCSGITGNLVIPEGVTSIGGHAFAGCSGITGDLVVPEGVTSIYNSTFEECNHLTGVVIPKGVTSIEKYAFLECRNLTEIVIPGEVTEVGFGAFSGCARLKTINYHGTPEQFAAITVDVHNEKFTGATVNYITD